MGICKGIWVHFANNFCPGLKDFDKTGSKLIGTLIVRTDIDCWKFLTTEIIGAGAMTLFTAKPKTESEIKRSTATVNLPVDTGCVNLSGGIEIVWLAKAL